MKSALGFLTLVLLFPAIAGSQQVGLTQGTRVRVTSPRADLDKYVGTVVELAGDSVAIAGRHGSRWIAFDDMTTLDVSVGTRPRILRDALIGFGAGALVGAAAGATAYEECNPEEFCFMPGSRSGDAALGGLVLGAAGAITGAIIGAFDRTDRWEPGHATVKAALAPSPSGGVSLSFSSTF